MKNEITGTKFRLIVMNFLQFAVWGAYLTSMGTYLYNIGLVKKSVCFMLCKALCHYLCRLLWESLPTVGYLLKSFWDSAILWELSL